ncbi:UNVERIFIED_CONTAM: hypothetical protein RMT77_007604 [Armadillidium vulgare]
MATSVQMIEKPAFATTWTQTPVEVNKNSLVNGTSNCGPFRSYLFSLSDKSYKGSQSHAHGSNGFIKNVPNGNMDRNVDCGRNIAERSSSFFNNKNSSSKMSAATAATAAAALLPTPPDSPPPNMSFHKGLLTDITTKLGLRNLLKVPTSNTDNYFLTRQCSYIFYCARIKVYCNYPKLTTKAIVDDDRVQEAIEKTILEELQDASLDLEADGRLYLSLLSKYKKQAIKTIKNMKAALSSTLIRITGYVLFKVFNFLFMSVTVNEGQLQMIEAASKRNIPLIFVPLHRSHVDYLFVTWILFNREIPAPIVAAGDNLRMPVFGTLLRGLGGFFIKRRLESTKMRKDYVYRAILQTYMSQALHSGYNLEFFIEGGRTRTGKPCLPKGGLLSVIVDAYLNGTLDDALIIPIAINYDRILDGNFIREQLGQKKVPESFWRAVRAIVNVLSTSYGHSRIDFGQPFSLNEFFQSSKLYLPNKVPLTIGRDLSNHSPESSSVSCQVKNSIPNGHHRSLSNPNNNFNSPSNPLSSNENGLIYSTRSNSSLFGCEYSEGYRDLVSSLASHIVYDAEKCQAIMSTNAVSWLLSYLHREGVTLDRLAHSVQFLQEDLRGMGRDTGFSGDCLATTIHAISMLGRSLVHVDGDPINDDPKCVFIRPVTVLPNVIELNYYANALSPLYAVDSIVATSLLTMADCDLWSYRDVESDCVISQAKLVERSKRLCHILRNEFIYVAPCSSLDKKINQSINNLVASGLLVNDPDQNERGFRRHYDMDIDNEMDDEETLSSNDEGCRYTLCPSTTNLEKLTMVTRGIIPLIESYYASVIHLSTLIGRPMPDQEFITSTQKSISVLLKKGVLLYGESIAVDPLRNALKLLETDGIIESYSQDNLKIIFLSKDFESEERLWSIQEEISSFRV